MSSKSPIQSKTIQFNGLAGIVATIVWPLLPTHIKTDPDWFQAIMGLVALGNILLRLVTKEPVKWKE